MNDNNHGGAPDLDQHNDGERTYSMDREIRMIGSEVEIRSVEEDSKGPGTLIGYALLFDEVTKLRDFNEVVDRRALDGVLERSDVRALFNHNPDIVLGRSPQTLRLEVDERGLRYEIDLPDTQWGRDTATLARRGDINQSSYAFRLAEGGLDWDAQSRTATIRQFDTILDVSPVAYPAQPLTEASMRSNWTPPSPPKEMGEPIQRKKETAAEIPPVAVVKPNKPTKLMNSNEMKALRSAHLAELKALTDSLSTEQRAADDNENGRIDDLNAKVADLDQKIARAEATEENLRRAALNAGGAGASTAEVKEQDQIRSRYSLTKAIHQSINGGLDGLEREMMEEGARALKDAGQPASGRLQIPGFIHQRATSTTSGTNLPGAGSSGLLEGLVPNPVIEQLGAQRLTGITGDIILPTLASDLTATKTETGTMASGSAIAARKLVANRIASRVDISSALIAQMNESVDRVVASQFQKATSAKVDALFLQDIVANVTFQKRRDTAAATVPGLSPQDAAHLHGVVGDAGAAMTSPGYLSSHGVLAYAKHTPTVTGGGIPTMINDRVLGHLALATGEAAPALITDTSYDTAGEVYAVAGAVTNLDNEAALVPIVFADFSDVYVAYWGGGAIDLIVDPYTSGADGIVRMIVNAYADAKVAHTGAAAWTVGA